MGALFRCVVHNTHIVAPESPSPARATRAHLLWWVKGLWRGSFESARIRNFTETRRGQLNLIIWFGFLREEPPVVRVCACVCSSLYSECIRLSTQWTVVMAPRGCPGASIGCLQGQAGNGTAAAWTLGLLLNHADRAGNAADIPGAGAAMPCAAFHGAGSRSRMASGWLDRPISAPRTPGIGSSCRGGWRWHARCNWSPFARWLHQAAGPLPSPWSVVMPVPLDNGIIRWMLAVVVWTVCAVPGSGCRVPGR